MNILDEILANQVKILGLLAVSPIAASVEIALNPEVISPVIVAPVIAAVVSPIVAPIIAPVIAAPIVAPVGAGVSLDEQSGVIELDKDGLPWDIRIHTKDPAKTVKHVWKAKKGAGKLNAADTDVVKAELRTAVTANPAGYRAFGDQQIKTDTVAPVVAAVVAPVLQMNAGLDYAAHITAGHTDASLIAQNLATMQTPVAAPIVAPIVAPVVIADPTATAKAEAIAHVAVLTNTWKVDFENITEVLGDFNNAASFDELAPEHYPAAALAFKTWVDWLITCQVQIDVIEKIGLAAGTQGVADTCAQYGVANTAGVHHKELAELHTKLQAYRAQWDAAIAKAI